MSDFSNLTPAEKAELVELVIAQLSATSKVAFKPIDLDNLEHLDETGEWPDQIAMLMPGNAVSAGTPDPGNNKGLFNWPLQDLATRTAILKALAEAKMDSEDGTGTGITELEKLILGGEVEAETHARVQINGFMRTGAVYLYPHVGDDPLNPLIQGQASVLRKKEDGSLDFDAGQTVFTFIASQVQKAAAGSVPMPGGLILKWGASANSSSTGYAQAVFPIAFPNACLFVIGVDRTSAGAGAGGVNRAGVLHDQMQPATAAFRITTHSGAAVSGDSVHYLAIGH